jgi:hypothetical protein
MNELPTMLKPGSSKLKESEKKILDEIEIFEKQEDETLKNMEETLSGLKQTTINIPIDADQFETSSARGLISVCTLIPKFFSRY